MAQVFEQSKLKQVRKGRMFEFTYPEVITMEQALDLQLEAGYHPSGYGFYGFEQTESETKWSCGDSCD